jgi:magnesium-transporting ATPase (P-type)
MALGFDKPSPGLMDRKPRPLSQPVLSRPQWVRIFVTGLLIAIGTLAVEAYYSPLGEPLAATMGFVVFAFFNIALGLSARSETHTVFDRENLSDMRQLKLYGLSLLFIVLPVGFGIGDRILGTTSISGVQWLVRIVAFGMLLIDEVIKFFMRTPANDYPVVLLAAMSSAAASEPRFRYSHKICSRKFYGENRCDRLMGRLGCFFAVICRRQGGLSKYGGYRWGLSWGLDQRHCL